jgi:4-hydroxy-3-polyprenylbenzoate decarboxylase
MTLDSLRDFVRALEEAGELVRVGEPVSVVKEITEVADRCMKSAGGGPALLFERPILPNGQTSRVPVAINLFGSHRRMQLALGVDSLDEIGRRIQDLLVTKVPDGLMEKLALLPKLA